MLFVCNVISFLSKQMLVRIRDKVVMVKAIIVFKKIMDDKLTTAVANGFLMLSQTMLINNIYNKYMIKQAIVLLILLLGMLELYNSHNKR